MKVSDNFALTVWPRHFSVSAGTIDTSWSGLGKNFDIRVKDKFPGPAWTEILKADIPFSQEAEAWNVLVAAQPNILGVLAGHTGIMEAAYGRRGELMLSRGASGFAAEKAKLGDRMVDLFHFLMAAMHMPVLAKTVSATQPCRTHGLQPWVMAGNVRHPDFPAEKSRVVVHVVPDALSETGLDVRVQLPLLTVGHLPANRERVQAALARLPEIGFEFSDMRQSTFLAM